LICGPIKSADRTQVPRTWQKKLKKFWRFIFTSTMKNRNDPSFTFVEVDEDQSFDDKATYNGLSYPEVRTILNQRLRYYGKLGEAAVEERVYTDLWNAEWMDYKGRDFLQCENGRKIFVRPWYKDIATILEDRWRGKKAGNPFVAHHCALIIGSHGVGKSILMHVLVRQLMEIETNVVIFIKTRKNYTTFISALDHQVEGHELTDENAIKLARDLSTHDVLFSKIHITMMLLKFIQSGITTPQSISPTFNKFALRPPNTSCIQARK